MSPHPSEYNQSIDTEWLRKKADELVIGHDDAKDKIIGVLAADERRASLIEAGYSPYDLVAKWNILVLGDTGTGKTTLLELLAKLTNRPFVRIQAADFSAAGYKGQNVEEALYRLIKAANGDITRARRGVIFIDEVDKCRVRNFGGQDDVGGRAVQEAFLPYLEGTTCLLRVGGAEVVFDTSGVTFVAAGAFEGLEELTDEALIRFGLIPEFVGRFTVRVRLEPLDAMELKQILTTPTTSPTWKAVNYFRHEGIELVFDDKALDAIVELALKRSTGARALHEIVSNSTLPLVTSIPQLRRDGVTKVVIDAPTIREGRAPWKIPAEPRYTPTVAVPLPESPPETSSRKVTDPHGWSSEAILARYEEVKQEIGWADASPSALRWWESLDRELRQQRPALLLRIAEELWIRGSNIDRFYGAYVNADTDNLQAILCFHDYLLLKEYERKKKVRRFKSGERCPSGQGGWYRFDGYLDGSTETLPKAEWAIVKPGQEFPTPKCGKPCWSAHQADRRNGT